MIIVSDLNKVINKISSDSIGICGTKEGVEKFHSFDIRTDKLVKEFSIEKEDLFLDDNKIFIIPLKESRQIKIYFE